MVFCNTKEIDLQAELKRKLEKQENSFFFLFKARVGGGGGEIYASEHSKQLTDA